MFYSKIVLVALLAILGYALVNPEAPRAENVLPQPPLTANQLFDTGGVVPETSKPEVKHHWTSKIRVIEYRKGHAVRVTKHLDTRNTSKPLVEGSQAIVIGGRGFAPIEAPKAVKAVIWTGNRIRSLPYLWGGGHGSFSASGYDCSGSVSYALHGAKLISSPMDSGSLESWGRSGRGKWITVETNSGHAYMYVAGIRFDTSGANPSRWQSETLSNSGFMQRHPSGL